MTSSSGKLGTFGGVFTPSILTILGVIMYLRLPWVVGQAGLWQSLAIIGVAHVVSVATGLSISSIATDKSVGAGGPYYIVSRSLGLPIGGTLGLALFLGLSFSISLYVIGFSESFLAYLEVPPTAGAIRLCGTLTLVALTAVTFISTTLAIRTQYLILGLILLSLLAIALGNPDVDALVAALPDDAAQPDPSTGFGTLFGIFFPAVTGFTAGVNMSGDLADPKVSIPTGTMAAIAAGLVVYAGLAVFLSLGFPAELLVGDHRFFENIAVWSPAVIGGVWGATLSSALGSILGAPRILQALGRDAIVPRPLANGVGATNEPRNALLVAFVIGEAGILIAELDVIAAVVSMVFLATYGFLNTAAAIESWVSPDFRPSFKIPRIVSVVGAAATLLLMIQLDPAAMFAAVLFMGGLYVYLQRRALRLETGDAWEGIWSSLVRSGLHRLEGAERHRRNWSPNILWFRRAETPPGPAIATVASSLVTDNGLLTEVLLSGRGSRPPKAAHPAQEGEEQEERPSFLRVEATAQPLDTIAQVCRYHGFASLAPNAVLVQYEMVREDEEAFLELWARLAERDLNVLLFSEGGPPRPNADRRIDLWWPGERTPALSLALARFLSRSIEYQDCRLRFLTVCPDGTTRDGVRNATRRMLAEARVSAEVEVLLDPAADGSLDRWVERHSADARLAVVELPSHLRPGDVARLDALRDLIHHVLWVRPDSVFQRSGRVFRLADRRAAAALDEAKAEPLVLEELQLPQEPALAAIARAFADRIEQTLDLFFEDTFVELSARHQELLEELGELVEGHFERGLAALEESHPSRRRRRLNRVRSTFLKAADDVLSRFVEETLPDQRDLLEEKLEALLGDASLVDAEDVDGPATVERDPGVLTPSEDDAPKLARLKSSLREKTGEGPFRQAVPVAALEEIVLDAIYTHGVAEALREFVARSFTLSVSVERLLQGSRASLEVLAGLEGDEAEARQSQKELALRHLEEARATLADDLLDLRQGLAQATRVRLNAFGRDLTRLDLSDRVRRRPKRRAREALMGLPPVLYERQTALVERARLGLRISAFQQRLTTIVERTEEQLALELRNGALSAVVPLRAALEAGDEPPPLDRRARFDLERGLGPLLREGRRSVDDLPEEVRTLDDGSIQRLGEGDRRATEAAVEEVEIPLRRLATFLLETELIGPLQRALGPVASLEARALSMAEDALRLNALEPADDEEGAEEQAETKAAALERLAEALAPLEAEAASLGERIATRLAAVLEGLDVYELSRSASALGAQQRLRQADQAVSGVRLVLQRGAAQAREGLIRLVYGQSAGVLLARRLQREDAAGARVDRLAAAVEEGRTRAEIPAYYRQLFRGQSSYEESFWVDRPKEQSILRAAVHQHERGRAGVLLVTGDPSAGKTALLRRLRDRTLSSRPTLWLPPPEGELRGPQDLDQAFREAATAAGLRGHDAVAAIDRLGPKGVVFVEDLERWWERRQDGFTTLDRLLELMARYCERVLFCVEVGRPAFDVLGRLRPRIGDLALRVVECGPVDARVLRDLVGLRHGSTGLAYDLEGTAEEDLGPFAQARLFARLFSWSRGLPGVALEGWLAHVDEVEDGRLMLRAPLRRQLDVELRPEWTALLVQALLHDGLTAERLLALSPGVEDALDALLRAGVLRRTGRGRLRVEPHLVPLILERLRERRVLP